MASGRPPSPDPVAPSDRGLLGFSDPDSYTAAEQGPGWVTFAGVMLLIIGSLNVVYGIAAIGDSKVYPRDVTYVFGDLHTWGWLLLLVGAAQFLAGIGIFLGNQIARWFGILAAGANAIVQLLALPSFPLLALTIFAVDVLVLYALIRFAGPRGARV